MTSSPSVCELLMVDERLFDGYELPETIEDALIFFRTEFVYERDDSRFINNNVPTHISNLLYKISRNPLMSQDEIIEEARRGWLCYHIKIQLNRDERKKELKLDCMNKIFLLCINNYNIFKTMGVDYIRITLNKIREVLDNVEHNNNIPVYYNAVKLRNMIYSAVDLYDVDNVDNVAG